MKRNQVRNRAIVLAVSLLAGVAIGLWMNSQMPKRQDRPAAAKAAAELPGHSHDAGTNADADVRADADVGTNADAGTNAEAAVNADMETNADAGHDHGRNDAMDMDMDMNMPGMEAGAGPSDGAEWEWLAGAPQAGKAGTLRITVTDAAGKPDAGLQVSHEKKLHLIVVSQGLSTFMHLHPAETAKPGVFEGAVTFPAAGRYKLIADFKPQGGEQQWQSAWVQVEGGSGTRQSEPALAADKQLERTADGVTVTLSLGTAPKAGEAVKLAFSFADRASGEPVRDLQPYLGAAGHVVILDAEARNYLHVHAMNEAGGPTAEFQTTFPEPGLYKIWGQFQRNDRIITVPYVIEVK